MSVGDARWPAGRVPWHQCVRAIVFSHGDFAADNKEKLVDMFVPVPDRGLRARKEDLH